MVEFVVSGKCEQLNIIEDKLSDNKINKHCLLLLGLSMNNLVTFYTTG